MSETNPKEIILHIPSEYDHRYYIKDRDDFLHWLQLRFANIDSANTLRIFKVKDNMKKYAMTLKDRKYGIDKLPSNEFRARDMEFAGSNELEEEKEESNSDEEIDIDSVDEKHDGIHINNFKEGNVKLDNSRSSVLELSAEMQSEEADFDPNGLIHRESILIFSSVVTEKPLTLEDFEILAILGKGTFGKVYLTKLRSNDKLYAIKSMRKDILIETDQVESTKLERDILLRCNHPFLLGMDFVFQNDLRIYFVMPFVKGGELYLHFAKNKRFPEEAVKFYAIQIILAIGYLHEQGIAHRDLKLENILIDEDGYLKIIDFGLAKIIKDEEEAMTFWGTPEYIAPEVISRKGHDKSVDWWAVGILIYEMLIGVTPFYNKN